MLKLCFLTVSVSPHQLPLAFSLVDILGEDNFRYIATSEPEPGRDELGWGERIAPPWAMRAYLQERQEEVNRWISDADILICFNRDLEVIQQRVLNKKITLYSSERWLKPPTGALRLLHPSYFRMALAFMELFKSGKLHYLPIGVHAASDMNSIAGLLRFFTRGKTNINQRMWGYFIKPSIEPYKAPGRGAACVRILWFGRFLKLKNIDLLVHAIRLINDRLDMEVRLKIVGCGPEKEKLEKLVKKLTLTELVEFRDPVPIDGMREEIRQTDVGVVSSNAKEGWSAAVNEIMAEGRCVIASKATGAGATLIKHGENGLLFESGSIESLVEQLSSVCQDRALMIQLAKAGYDTIKNIWSPFVAANRLVDWCGHLLKGDQSEKYPEGPLC